MNVYWRILTCVAVVVKISAQATQNVHESLEIGLIGCRFEQNLCNQHERCLDDDIFGRCVTLPNDYSGPVTGGRKGRMILSDDDLATLERTFRFLKNSGAHWKSKETQCILRYILSVFHPEEKLNLSDCDELENIIVSIRESSETESELDADIPKSGNDSPFYIDDVSSKDSQGIFSRGFENGVDDLYYDNPDPPYALPIELENSDSAAAFVSPLEQFDTIFQSDEENPKGILLKRTENGGDSMESSDEVPNRANKDGFPFKFERQERLDVKKPGPWFAVNNFAFADRFDHYDDVLDDSRERFNPLERKELFFTNNYRPAIPAIVAWKKLKSIAKNVSKLEKENEQSPSADESNLQPITHEELTDQLSSERKIFNKDTRTEQLEASNPHREEIVEASYVFITVKESFESWKDGAQLVNTLAQLLKVPPETFNDVGVSGNQVSFRIMPNTENVDPFKVVEKTDELRGSIRQLRGVEIDSIGIGDEAKVSSVLFRHHSNRQIFNILVVCFATTAALAMVIILWFVRRRWLIRRKLKDVTSASSQEVTRDYQDLCRARMASKTSDGSKDLPRISQPHLSRDSESSRSSTSSWCEEPVLTNMDISTGHMVLSYMEDHLRNRDRLDREWMALCAYEAEPCVSTNIGSRAEFKEKNRYEDVLPYDNSRVVLNSVANPRGFDYINASLIADHDPRHPAYIAAQTPMADSVADFWQMIWEQGTVVLVLLTRLTENGKEQCHLYWPTEGSQLYHIYEVHLVSEHIWCDDYLVRSFYLKNIRTGETRTVTQFHFLSWTENGVPASTRALLEFRRKINKSYRGRSSPILVHCSDGAGRTGTYCLIDMVLHRMAKGAREIDIAATLEHVRDQRMKAVRTKQQFEFVLTAVAEEVHAILRALPQ